MTQARSSPTCDAGARGSGERCLSRVLCQAVEARCLQRDRTQDRGAQRRDTLRAIRWARSEAREAAWCGLLIELSSGVQDLRPCRWALSVTYSPKSCQGFVLTFL